MFAERLEAAAARTQRALSVAMAEFADQPVTHAMRYAVAGGKGLRGFLVLEGARLHGVDDAPASLAAAAIEAIHAYSLIHDDLPAMDNDDLRRGQPTVHVKWDEATAVLAGDALQALAFDLLSRSDIGAPEISVALVQSLARASGADGMVLGQALDIAAEVADTPLDMAAIEALQAKKTGALFDWAACAGPRLAGHDPSAMAAYARALGLAFQIADDILDVEGDEETAGKRLGKDAEAGKATVVGLLGLDEAKAYANRLVDAAIAALEPYDGDADVLRETARFVIARKV